MRWKRIATYAFALFFLAQVIGFLYGLSTSWWLGDGSNAPQAMENARLARRVTVAIVGFAVYLAFFRGIKALLLANAAGVFLLSEFFSVALEFSFTHSLTGLVSLPFLAAHVAICAVALAASQVAFRKRGQIHLSD